MRLGIGLKKTHPVYIGMGYDPDAILFWQAAGVNPSNNRKREISDLIIALKTTRDGSGVSLWDGHIDIGLCGIGIDDYGYTNAGDRTFAKRGLKRVINLTETSGANTSFTTDVGFTFTASTAAVLDSGYNLSTGGNALYTQNQNGCWVILASGEQSPTNSAIFVDAATRLGSRDAGTPNGVAFGANDNTLGSVVFVGDASGLTGMARTSSLAADCNPYKGRVLMPKQTLTSTSIALPSATVKFGGNGSTLTIVPPIWAWGIGKGLDLTGFQGVHDVFLG
jgi:hypothetical protein